jgi:hypothetical protein
MLIAAYRGNGLRPAPDAIIEPLLSDAALLHRARAELDAKAHPVTDLQLTIVPMQGLRLGQLVATANPATTALQVGKITALQIDVTPTGVAMQATLEVAGPA